MVANASREVLFVLRPVPSEDAAAQFGRMVSLAEQANQKILQATEKASEEWAKSWAAATERTVGGRIDAEQRALQRATAEQSKALAAREREEAKAARSQERAIAQRAKEEERARREAEKAADRQFKTEVALMEKAAKEERRRWDEEKKSREQAADDDRRRAEKASRDQEKAQRQAESALERQRSAAMAAKMSIAELGEGITRMGRGLATIGILGEESTEKLVRAFMRVQGVFDVVAGGLKVYKSLTVAVESYTKSVEAAAVAERALAAARGQSAVAGGASLAGAGGVAGAGALGTAGMIGGAGLAIAGGAVAAGLMTPWGQRRAESMMVNAMSGDGGPGWMGRGGAYLQGALSPVQWFRSGDPWSNVEESQRTFAAADAARRQTEAMAAGRKAMLAGIDPARDAERERQQQLASLADLERQQKLLGVNARPSLAGLMGAGNERFAALEATRPGSLATDQERGEYSLAERRLQRELALQQQQAAAEAGLTGARGAFGVESAAFRDAQQRAQAERERMATLQGTNKIDGRIATGADRARLEEAIAATSKAEQDAMARLASANEQRIQQEERIAGIRQASAEAAIQSTQEEIALRESLIEKDRQRLMSAAERIASMTKAEQEQYGQLIQKARGGGELSAEEFRKLGTVSTEETEKLRRDYAEKMSAGFFQQFGVGDIERRRMQDNEKLQQELRVRLEDQRKLSVDVQIDSERIVREVSEEASKIIDAQMGRAIDEIKKNLEGSLGGMTRQRNEAAQARAAVIR
ncbi:MAG: hypothetical protein KJZ87_06055 [Thermoguttaceae bacterium]|nr:hypothetical protein [Thermoguttaceae bacterium]